MPTLTPDKRVAELEAKVTRLLEFNQILLSHLLDFQKLPSPITPADLPVWVTDLSDEVWNKYRYSTRI